MGIVLGRCGGKATPTPFWITEIAGIGKGQQHSSLDTHQNGTCCSNCCHCSCSCCPVWPVSHKACSLICACPGVCFACSAGTPSSCEADSIMPFVSGCFGGFRGPGVDKTTRAICLLSASLIYGLFLFIYILFSSCFYFYMISSCCQSMAGGSLPFFCIVFIPPDKPHLVCLVFSSVCMSI